MRSESRRDEFAGQSVCSHTKKRHLIHSQRHSNKEKESPEEVSQEAGDEVVDSSEWHQIALCKYPPSSENERVPVDSDFLNRARPFITEAHHLTLSLLGDVDSG